jgi:ABC-type antimicrobial peptide transport system permease subunit
MGGAQNTSPMITVVGIVGNVRHNGVTAEVKPKFYRPFGQFHQSTGNPARNMTLIVKASGDPRALVSPIRAEIRRMDQNLPVAAVQTMDEIVADALATPRITGSMLTLFAALAVALAAVGIYGVLSYVVSQRRQEIGIRVAIGADRRHIVGLILKNGLALALTGIVVGLGIAALAMRAMASQLYDVRPLDPLTFATVAAILITVSTGACLIPALRAVRVSPTRALKAD